MMRTSELQVLDHLTLVNDGQRSVSRIARDIGLSKGAVSKAVKVLCESGLIRVEQSGRNMLCSVERHSPVMTRLRIAFSLVEIVPGIASLHSCSERVVLFGSCAQGVDTADSDIDILVITRNKDEVGKKVRAIIFSRPVQWVIKTPQEYVVLNSKEDVFVSEIEQGIELWRSEGNV